MLPCPSRYWPRRCPEGSCRWPRRHAQSGATSRSLCSVRSRRERCRKPASRDTRLHHWHTIPSGIYNSQGWYCKEETIQTPALSGKLDHQRGCRLRRVPQLIFCLHKQLSKTHHQSSGPVPACSGSVMLVCAQNTLKQIIRRLVDFSIVFHHDLLDCISRAST